MLHALSRNPSLAAILQSSTDSTVPSYSSYGCGMPHKVIISLQSRSAVNQSLRSKVSTQLNGLILSCHSGRKMDRQHSSASCMISIASGRIFPPVTGSQSMATLILAPLLTMLSAGPTPLPRPLPTCVANSKSFKHTIYLASLARATYSPIASSSWVSMCVPTTIALLYPSMSYSRLGLNLPKCAALQSLLVLLSFTLDGFPLSSCTYPHSEPSPPMIIANPSDPTGILQLKQNLTIFAWPSSPILSSNVSIIPS
jgi:hypothetical protein